MPLPALPVARTPSTDLARSQKQATFCTSPLELDNVHHAQHTLSKELLQAYAAFDCQLDESSLPSHTPRSIKVRLQSSALHRFLPWPRSENTIY